MLQPKAHRSPSRNLQHPRNPMSPPVEAAPGGEWSLSPAQGSCAVTEQSPGTIPKPPIPGAGLGHSTPSLSLPGHCSHCPQGQAAPRGHLGTREVYEEKLFIRRDVKWVQCENKASVCCAADTWIPTSVAPTRRILLKGCGLIFRVYKRTHTLSFLTVLLSYT